MKKLMNFPWWVYLVSALITSVGIYIAAEESKNPYLPFIIAFSVAPLGGLIFTDLFLYWDKKQDMKRYGSKS